MTEIELKNCPFCEAELIKEAYGHRHGYDPLKSCPLSGIAWLVDSENFAKWNTRPIESQLQTHLTLAVEALETIAAPHSTVDHKSLVKRYETIAKTILTQIKGE